MKPQTKEEIDRIHRLVDEANARLRAKGYNTDWIEEEPETDGEETMDIVIGFPPKVLPKPPTS